MTAEQETLVIYPTGVAKEDLAPEQRCPNVGCTPSDAQLVQAAVNDLGLRGVDGTVLLKATNLAGVPTQFNFGLFGPYYENVCANGPIPVGVCFSSPYVSGQSGALTFLGETIDGHQTTIYGGYFALFFARDALFTVKNIKFTDTYLSSIAASKVNGMIVQGNTILRSHYSGAGNTGSITVGKFAHFEAEDTRGHVEYKDNYINAEGGLGYHNGIMILNTAVTSEVKDNTIVNMSGWGIRNWFFRDDQVIKDNVVIVYNSPTLGEWSDALEVVCDRSTGASVAIVKDNVLTGDSDILSIYSDVPKTGEIESCPIVNSEFKDNTIIMNNTDSAGGRLQPNAGVWVMSIRQHDGSTGLVANNIFKDNTFVGTNEFAYLFGFSEYGDASNAEDVYGNVIKDNNYSGFTLALEPDLFYGLMPAHVHFGLSTHDNYYQGKVGEVVDNTGTNNTVVLLP